MKIIRIPFSIMLCAALFITSARTANALDTGKTQTGQEANSAVAKPMAVVDIPDSNLNKYLHGKTGVPMSKPVRRQDLAALSGKLEPKGKNIANAEGIQYCAGIEELDLSGNKLTAMPDLKAMARLKSLNLSGNRFTALPEEICTAPKLESLNMEKNAITSLAGGVSGLSLLKSLSLAGNKLAAFPAVLLALKVESLDISDNGIESLPDNISAMADLHYLTAAGCKLKKLPDAFYKMSWLRKADFNGNGIESLGKGVKGLESLEALYLNGNMLKSLPSEICALPKLKVLSVNGNTLGGLPSKIGDLKLEELYAEKNEMSAVPGSLAEMTTLKKLDLRLNRLKKLPSELDRIGFEYINVEWNYLDISDNSSIKKMMEGIKAASGPIFLRQLTPLENATASSTPESVTLYWDKCADGSDDTASWTVQSYTIYAVNGDTSSKVAEVPPTENTCSLTELSPSTIYTYRIGVEYKVNDSTAAFDGTNHIYTEIEVRTAATEAPATPEASVTVTPEASQIPTPAPTVSTSPPASAAALYNGETGQGNSMLLYVALAGVSIIAVAAIVLVVIVLVKKKPNPR
jgi:Leucine-rich repeat (LRR) protein